VAESEKKIVSLDTQVELKQASIRDEEARVATLQANLSTLQNSLEAKTLESTQLQNTYSTLKASHEAFQAKFASKQELLQTLQTGLADSANTSGGGYLGQLADANARVVQAQTEEEQLKRQCTLVERELTDARGRWKAVEREAGEGKARLERGKKEVEQLERRVKVMGWSEEKEKESSTALKAARDEMRALNEVRISFHFHLIDTTTPT